MSNKKEAAAIMALGALISAALFAIFAWHQANTKVISLDSENLTGGNDRWKVSE